MNRAALTDEQRLLRETAAGLSADFRADPDGLEGQRREEAGWNAVADLGLLDMRLAESVGGAGASAFEAALVAEEFGRGPGVIPFLGPILAAELIRLASAGAERPTAGADPRATVGLDPRLLGLAAADRSDAVAWDAAGAGRAAVLLDEGGRSLVGLAAVADRELPSTDLTRTMGRVYPSASLETAGEIDAEGLRRWLAFALAMLGADLVGSMSGALELAVGYARDRKQFGAPIGAFQALAHELADAYVLVRAARSAVYRAAWAVDNETSSKALLAARVAKAYAAQAAINVAERAMQIHGAMGTTWESLCHVYLRRVVVDATTLGDQDTQLMEIAAVRTGR